MSIHFGTSAHARCITWANSLCSRSESSPSEASSDELNSQLERFKSNAKVLKARPRARGRKPKDFMVRDHFDIVPTSSGTYRISCKGENCGWTKEWIHMNTTFLRKHLVNSCESLSEAEKTAIVSSSQTGKRIRAMQNLKATAATFGSETLANIRQSKFAEINERQQKKVKQLPIVPQPDYGLVEQLNADQANAIILRKVEPQVARKEAVDRILCPFVQAEMLADHPAIGAYLPKNSETVFSNFVVPIDQKSSKEVYEIFKTKPGLASLGMDSATINSKSKVVYTGTKSDASVFIAVRDLKSHKHVSSAEKEDGYKIAKKFSKSVATRIGSILVDNAAQVVARGVADMIEAECGHKVLVLR